MCSIFNLILSFVVLSIFDRRLASGDWIKHECKTKEDFLKLNETKIVRLLINESVIFIFTDHNEVIRTKIPYFEIENDRKYLIYGQSYQKKYEKLEGPENFRSIGLITRQSKESSTFQYFKHPNGTVKAFCLKFDKIPGELGGDANNEIALDDIRYLLTTDLFFKFIKQDISRIITYSGAQNLTRKIKFQKSYHNDDRAYNKHDNLTYNPKHLVFYENEPLINSSLIEIDDQENIYIQLFNKDDRSFSLTHKLRLPDLSNCRCINRVSDVKGIFYANSAFYIFINHFYIRSFDTDLIDNEFVINSHLFDDAVDLELGEDFRYENLYSTWVKTFENSSYLVIRDQMFELLASVNESSLEIVKITDQNNLKYCLKQTLNVNNYVYCFEETKYHFLYDIKNPKVSRKDMMFDIVDLLNQTDTIYETDQELIFIFNYIDKYVFMTKSHLFLIEHNQFKVDNNFNLILTGNISKLKNSFFDRMDTSTGMSNKRSKMSRVIVLVQILIVIIVVLGSAILAISFVCKNFAFKNSSDDQIIEKKLKNRGNLTDQINKSKSSIVEFRSRSLSNRESTQLKTVSNKTLPSNSRTDLNAKIFKVDSGSKPFLKSNQTNQSRESLQSNALFKKVNRLNDSIVSIKSEDDSMQ